MAKLTGLVPPLLTPLNADGTLDKAGLEKLINHCIDGGATGIFLCGSCGEGSFFTDEFRREISEESIRIIGGRVPILLGILENTTSKVIRGIKAVDDLAIDYYVIVAPYYIPATQPMILKHVNEIAASTKKNLLIYNIPPFTNSVIAPETMRELCKLPTVVGCKDTNSSWPTVQRELFFAKKDDFVLLTGDEEICGVNMLLGSDGVVAGTGNIYPQFFTDFYEAAAAKDVDKVYEYMERLDAFKAVMRTNIHWIPRLKYLAARKGLMQEHVASPLIPLTDAEKAQIEEILKDVEKNLY